MGINIGGVNYSYDYSELIKWIREDLEDRIIRPESIIMILRDKRAQGYSPIIHYYTDADIEEFSLPLDEVIDEDLYSEEELEELRTSFVIEKSQYEQDKNSLEPATATAVLTEMEFMNKIFSSDFYDDEEEEENKEVKDPFTVTLTETNKYTTSTYELSGNDPRYDSLLLDIVKGTKYFEAYLYYKDGDRKYRLASSLASSGKYQDEELPLTEDEFLAYVKHAIIARIDYIERQERDFTEFLDALEGACNGDEHIHQLLKER